MNHSIIPVIINPYAGRGVSDYFFCTLTELLQKSGMQLQLSLTQSPRHAATLSRGWVEKGVRTILAIGGDGTAFEVINGIMNSGRAEEVRLGILPMGTGNSFLRDFSITEWRQVADCILAGKNRTVDIGKVRYSQDGKEKTVFFHNVLGLGMMARGCALRHDRFRFLGKYGYHAAFFWMLPHHKTCRMQIGYDDKELSIQTPILAICNSQYTGHDMKLCPISSVEDGQFEIIYIDPVSSWDILKLFSQIKSGDHIKSSSVHVLQAKKIRIAIENDAMVMIDGEMEGCPPLDIEVLPGALQIFA